MAMSDEFECENRIRIRCEFWRVNHLVGVVIGGDIRYTIFVQICVEKCFANTASVEKRVTYALTTVSGVESIEGCSDLNIIREYFRYTRDTRRLGRVISNARTMSCSYDWQAIERSHDVSVEIGCVSDSSVKGQDHRWLPMTILLTAPICGGRFWGNLNDTRWRHYVI